MAGHRLPTQRWLMQAGCRESGNWASQVCMKIAATPSLQGTLSQVEQDALFLYETLKIAQGDDQVKAAIAARDIAALIEHYHTQIVGFMGLFPAELADQILAMPAKAALAKRWALIEWQQTGEMPDLVREWARRDESILREYEAAGAGTKAPDGPAPSRAFHEGSGRLVLAAAALAVAAWVWGR